MKKSTNYGDIFKLSEKFMGISNQARKQEIQTEDQNWVKVASSLEVSPNHFNDDVPDMANVTTQLYKYLQFGDGIYF